MDESFWLTRKELNVTTLFKVIYNRSHNSKYLSLRCVILIYMQSNYDNEEIKTHGSESRGQEEAACATTTVSILHVAPL